MSYGQGGVLVNDGGRVAMVTPQADGDVHSELLEVRVQREEEQDEGYGRRPLTGRAGHVQGETLRGRGDNDERWQSGVTHSVPGAPLERASSILKDIVILVSQYTSHNGCSNAHTPSHTHTHTLHPHTVTPSHTHTYTHTHTLTASHTHTHTHTLTHTHTPSQHHTLTCSEEERAEDTESHSDAEDDPASVPG